MEDECWRIPLNRHSFVVVSFMAWEYPKSSCKFVLLSGYMFAGKQRAKESAYKDDDEQQSLMYICKVDYEAKKHREEREKQGTQIER